MFLSPEALLCIKSREQCITRLNDLPEYIRDEKTKKRHAAVLVPLCVVNGEVCLLFTLRSSNLSTHSGQVSFPGGKMDENEDSYQTALRETEEEIGIPSTEINIWTKMSQMRGRDPGMVITPIVGELKNFDVKKLRPNESEVADIFTVPMEVFCNKENHACFMYNDVIVPVFICGKYKIWGITGLITHLFLQCFLPNGTYEVDFSRKVYKLDELMPSKL